MLQWWGSDRAVQSERYLASSHYHLTSPPFHRNPLTLAVVCLSMHPIAMLPQPYRTTIYSFYLMVWLQPFCSDLVNFMARLQALCSAVWLRVFLNFENLCSDRRQDCEHDSEIINDDGSADMTWKFVRACHSSAIHPVWKGHNHHPSYSWKVFSSRCEDMLQATFSVSCLTFLNFSY